MLALPPQSSKIPSGSLPESCWSLAFRLQTSPHNSPTEGANLERCFLPSHSLSTAVTGPKRLGVRSSLATSNIKHTIWVSPGRLS